MKSVLLTMLEISIAKSGDVNSGPYKLKSKVDEWKTTSPMGSYITRDPNGQVLNSLDHNKGGEGLHPSIKSYIDKLQNSDGSEEESQNLFQR
jgi:hypothetical protein